MLEPKEKKKQDLGLYFFYLFGVKKTKKKRKLRIANCGDWRKKKMISNPHATSNGRVNIQQPATSVLFQMHDKIPIEEMASLRNPTMGIWMDTVLSQAFFSRDNLQIIQNGIRAGVYRRSNQQYVIAPQDPENIQIIARSVFLQHAKNMDENVTEQIEAMNRMVIDYCVKQVYSEAQGYIKYVVDASTLVTPIAHPVMSSMNDRQLEMKSWF